MFYFFIHDTATPEIYTLSLHDALPIFGSDAQKERYLPKMAKGEIIGCFGLTEPDAGSNPAGMRTTAIDDGDTWVLNGTKDRKSTRLNSSHMSISYAVFCLKKKTKKKIK